MSKRRVLDVCARERDRQTDGQRWTETDREIGGARAIWGREVVRDGERQRQETETWTESGRKRVREGERVNGEKERASVMQRGSEDAYRGRVLERARQQE